MSPAEVAALLANKAAARARRREANLPPRLPEPTPRLSQSLPPVWVLKEDVITLELPLPPSVNAAYGVAARPMGKGKARGMMYETAAGKAYKKLVASLCSGMLPHPRDVMLAFSGTIRMERAGCDLDDRFKQLFDALEGFIYENDEQVARIGPVDRIVDSKNPGVTAVFTPIAVDRYGKPKEETCLPF